jgi:hypothetical protein
MNEKDRMKKLAGIVNEGINVNSITKYIMNQLELGIDDAMDDLGQELINSVDDIPSGDDDGDTAFDRAAEMMDIIMTELELAQKKIRPKLVKYLKSIK